MNVQTIGQTIGTARHYLWLRGIVLAIVALNILDGLFTIVWVHGGWANEANPLLADLVVHEPRLFLVFKTGLLCLCLGLLWRLRQRRLAVVGIFATFLGYYALLLYHLDALNLKLWQRLFI